MMMMLNPKTILLDRLQSIAQGLQATPHGLGLLALGSVGREVERIDQFSDLDFFAIVEQGTKDQYLTNLTWLQKQAKLVYTFRNTKDGFKILYEDGVYGEMAIFDLNELQNIPYSPGKVLWQKSGIDIPEISAIPTPSKVIDFDYELNELLTNLYVGLTRLNRGESLSAHTLIQHYAVHHVVTLLIHERRSQEKYIDLFAQERRVEQHDPAMQHILSKMLLGYERTRESAVNILNFVKVRWVKDHPLITKINSQLQYPTTR